MNLVVIGNGVEASAGHVHELEVLETAASVVGRIRGGIGIRIAARVQRQHTNGQIVVDVSASRGKQAAAKAGREVRDPRIVEVDDPASHASLIVGRYERANLGVRRRIGDLTVDRARDVDCSVRSLVHCISKCGELAVVDVKRNVGRCHRHLDRDVDSDRRGIVDPVVGDHGRLVGAVGAIGGVNVEQPGICWIVGNRRLVELVCQAIGQRIVLDVGSDHVHSLDGSRDDIERRGLKLRRIIDRCYVDRNRRWRRRFGTVADREREAVGTEIVCRGRIGEFRSGAGGYRAV